jgi:very-short-patch-repair endonuclease
MPARSDRIATTIQINSLCARQHGAVSAAQLAELGLTRKAIRHRVEVGELEIARHGVYVLPASSPTLSHRLTVALLSMTSARRAPDLIAATGYTALTLYGLAPERDTIELVERGELRRSQANFVVHQSNTLAPEDIVYIAGVPVVSAAFAIVAVSGRLTELALRGLVRDALATGVATLTQFSDALDRHGPASTRQWSLLRQIVAVRMQAQLLDAAESVLEERVITWLTDEGFTDFVLQHEVVTSRGTRRVDIAFVDRKVAVEVDGHRFHSTAERFHDDRKRDLELRVAGWDLLHVSAATTKDEFVGALRMALGQRWHGSLAPRIDIDAGHRPHSGRPRRDSWSS